MAITPKKYVRKPFAVEAEEVTAENMAEVAAWCNGELRSAADDGGEGTQRYIKVQVKKPLNKRQTQAYVGDFVVMASDQNIRGFKVYTPRAFTTSFDAIAEDMITTLERMDERAREENQYEQDELGFAEELRQADKTQVL